MTKTLRSGKQIAEMEFSKKVEGIVSQMDVTGGSLLKFESLLISIHYFLH